MKVDESIKEFLLKFPYQSLHEHDVLDNDIEHFFVGIAKSDIKTKILKKYIETHCSHYPIKNLSKASMTYLDNNTENYYLLIDSLDKNDLFYKQKAKFIENNTANILSLKWTGETADMSAHLVYNAEKYITDFKDISVFLSEVAKDKIKEKITQGYALFEEKKPFLEAKIKKIFKK